MTMITYFIAEQDLHGYVDNQLDQRRRKAVEQYLIRHAVLAETVAAYRAQNAALAKLVKESRSMPDPIKTLMRDLAHRLTDRSSETDTTSTARWPVASAKR